MRPAKKRFGQHFLERAWAEKVVRAIAPTADQTFFEIGPGRGAITALLASAAREVFAFEIDRDLAESLRRDGPPTVSRGRGRFPDDHFGTIAFRTGRAGSRANVHSRGGQPALQRRVTHPVQAGGAVRTRAFRSWMRP